MQLTSFSKTLHQNLSLLQMKTTTESHSVTQCRDQKILGNKIHLHHKSCIFRSENHKKRGSQKYFKSQEVCYERVCPRKGCIHILKQWYYQWKCYYGMGKILQFLDNVLQATMTVERRFSFSQGYKSPYWLFSVDWSALKPYTQRHQKQTQYVTHIDIHTGMCVTITIKKERGC